MRSHQALATCVALTLPLALWAQGQSTTAPVAPPSATPAAAQPAAPAAKTFSQQDLDTILAPIALYQDALLAQIFMASTYPLEVVEAARWSAANPTVKDKALEDAMQKQDWDPSVKSLTSVPTVLKHMNEKLDWTQKLGDAFLAQQADVMATVQSLRGKAAANGNLKTTPEQTVKTEQEGGKTVYIVESSKPETVYVPTYNPSTVYGTWWYPSYPPYYMYPPGYAYAPGLAFATGVVVGAAIWGNLTWGGGYGNVNINVNKYNNFNKTNISNGNWNHAAEHRKGASYRDAGTAQKYNRGASQNAASREQFRGRAESQGLGADSRGNVGGQGGQGGQRLSASDRSGGTGSFGGGASASNRSAGRGDRGGGGYSGGGRSSGSSSASSRGGGGGGFSGAGGSGASARAASSRGSASRGGGGRGGGGRR
ncbi:hypothetical protein BWI17_01395 [Betaproteobacteria bacterium GR16-43]|nr:hypothetical protein BWI17_01395 [Betaproteobacteria bacterium GR16-43]